MKKYIVEQNYQSYTEEDHATWRKLCKRQDEFDTSRVSKAFLDGIKMLKIDRDRIPRIEEVKDLKL